MKLATIRVGTTTKAARVESDHLVEIESRDVGLLLANRDCKALAAAASGRQHEARSADYPPPSPNPSKIICVGLNYRSHILEMGRELPEVPTLFAKFSTALVGANDDIKLPKVSDEIDWEAELAVL